MKTIKLLLSSMALALLFVSCQPATTKFISEFTAFVEDVERNHTIYSDNDAWQSIDTQLQNYMSRFKELNAQQQFSEEEKKQVGELVVRFYKARFSDLGMFKVVRWVGQRWDYFTGIIEGFGIQIDVCGFVKDLIGVDVCQYLNFGGTDNPAEIHEPAVNE